eukprot:gene16080-41931_t
MPAPGMFGPSLTTVGVTHPVPHTSHPVHGANAAKKALKLEQ